MTLRELIDALIQYEAAHPQVANDEITVEVMVGHTIWYGCLIEGTGHDEEGRSVIRAVSP